MIVCTIKSFVLFLIWSQFCICFRTIRPTFRIGPTESWLSKKLWKAEDLFFASTTSSIEMTVETNYFSQFFQSSLPSVPHMHTLYPILDTIANACREINQLVRHTSTNSLSGLYVIPDNSQLSTASTISVNIQGEKQYKMDVIANQLLKSAVCRTGCVNLVASEEDESPCYCDTSVHHPSPSSHARNYAIVIDPLDGSSNIDSGLPTGTIFGIYRSNHPLGATMDTLLQSGCELVASGYCLYSAATHLAIALKHHGVHMFTLEDATGQFRVSKTNVQIPDEGAIYSFNDAYSLQWAPSITRFLHDLKCNNLPICHNSGAEEASMGKEPLSRYKCKSYEENTLKKPSKITARYVGALVADVHNILLSGGIFGYPLMTKQPHRDQGKLRLLYEANPLAMLVQEAGGKASDGYTSILQKPVNDVHQRTPLFIGSAPLVTTIEKYIAEHDETD